MKRTALHILSLLLLLLIATSCMRNEEDWTQPSIIVHVNSIYVDSINAFGGQQAIVVNDTLFIGEMAVAGWTDNNTTPDGFNIALSHNGTEIEAGGTVDSEGVLTLFVTDNGGCSLDVTFLIVCEPVIGMENLLQKTFRADSEYDLLDSLSAVNGFCAYTQ